MATLSRAFPVARRPHHCGSCGQRIEPGEQYHRWTGTGDCWEGVMTLKECRECFARYVVQRVHLSPENLTRAEAWLGCSLASPRNQQED
jgi:predicted RNA-binding Zn-ribbon protein involved in translation (DUF1610 family)